MIRFLILLLNTVARAAIPLARLAGALTGLVDALKLKHKVKLLAKQKDQKNEHRRKARKGKAG